MKEESKEKALQDKKHNASVFDLQQNILIPKSNRGELYYKRRLAVYNFTVYDLASHDGYCYLANESLTKRGANEISTYIFDYLTMLDDRGVETVDLYSDGCSGQNRNSVLPGMFHRVLTRSRHLRQITLHFFEKSHGQSEGDSMHSTIEKSISRKEEILHPCQLSELIQDARQVPRPYVVRHVKTTDILDWKTYSQDLSILKCRETDSGVDVDWTKFKQIQVSKESPLIIKFKNSHCEKVFHKLDLGKPRNLRSAQNFSLPRPTSPTPMYKSRPKLAAGKYQDLLSLCRGPFPVISQPELADYEKKVLSKLHNDSIGNTCRTDETILRLVSKFFWKVKSKEDKSMEVYKGVRRNEVSSKMLYCISKRRKFRVYL